jgi:hypothetical protein
MATVATAVADPLAPLTWDCPNQIFDEQVVGQVGDTVEITILGPCAFTAAGTSGVVSWDGGANPTAFDAGPTIVTFTLVADGVASLTSVNAGLMPTKIVFIVSDLGVFTCSVDDPPENRTEAVAGNVGNTVSVYINGGCAITTTEPGVITWSPEGSGDPPVVTNKLLIITLMSEGETGFTASWPAGGRSQLSILFTVSPGCDPDLFAGGLGSAGSPFEVSSTTQLAALSATPGCWVAGLHFRQTRSITLSGPWTPIGSEPSPFQGTYDGAGNTISGLLVNDPAADASGLFGALSGATVSNLTINGSITGNDTAGGLTSSAVNTTISNVHTNVAITLQGANGGGLIGYVTDDVTITDSSATGNITGGAANYGGLVGIAFPQTTATALTIRRSWSSGNASGTGRYVGGLLGGMDARDSRIIIDRSYATGNVTGGGPGYVGGLVGFATNAEITDSYTRGSVNAGAFVSGGIIGETYDGAFTRVYGVNVLTSTGLRGGVTGAIQETPTFTGVVWNNEIGVTAPVDGVDVLPGATGANTAAMKLIRTYQDLGWPINPQWSPTTTWIICSAFNDGYPYLAAFYTAATDPCTPRNPSPNPGPEPGPGPGKPTSEPTPTTTPLQPETAQPTTPPQSDPTQQAIDDVRALSPAQIRALTAGQLAALPPEAFAVMTPRQIRALRPKQVRLLNASQIRAIQPDALRAMGPRTLQAFTLKQIRAFTDEQAARLRPKQINALGPKKKARIEQQR